MRRSSVPSGRRWALSRYELRYLLLFWEDLFGAASYIKNVLHNEAAAKKLLDEVEAGILRHFEEPTLVPVYKSAQERRDAYHWFSAGNYMVFYVVVGEVMEVRRLVYGARDLTKIKL